MVDAVITDPPYNVSRDTQSSFSNMGRTGLNYGKWDYGFNQTEWIKEVPRDIRLEWLLQYLLQKYMANNM